MPLNLVLHAKGVLKIRGKVENYNKNLNYTRIPANLRLKNFFQKIIFPSSKFANDQVLFLFSSHGNTHYSHTLFKVLTISVIENNKSITKNNV